MIATFFAACLVLFILLGWIPIDAFATWNRKRRTMRREVARPSALPRKMNAHPPSGCPGSSPGGRGPGQPNLMSRWW